MVKQYFGRAVQDKTDASCSRIAGKHRFDKYGVEIGSVADTVGSLSQEHWFLRNRRGWSMTCSPG
jgi:hypothetical protein